MECGCAAQRLGMMDYCCLSLGWQQCLRSVCGQAAPQPEANPLLEWGRSGGVRWDAQKPGFTLIPYFLLLLSNKWN